MCELRRNRARGEKVTTEPSHWLLHVHSTGARLAWGSRHANWFAKQLGFSVLVLTADEYRDDGALAATGVHVVHYPSVDDAWLAEQPFFRKGIIDRGKLVASAVAQGHHVLVTCAEGYNRSALLAARAMHELTGRSGEEILVEVKKRRPEALFNMGFVDWIRSWKGV